MIRLLLAGLLVTAVGVALVAWRVTTFIAGASAVSSTSGQFVLRRPDGTLGGFSSLHLVLEPAVLGIGLLVVVGAVIALAFRHAIWASRASTAAVNADAQTR